MDIVCLEALERRELTLGGEMDSPELTERFVKLASMDNHAIVFYYRNFIMPLVRRYIKPGDHMLDMGCAGGVLLTLLREKGYKNLYGIDAAQVLLDRIPDKTIPTVCDNYLNVKDHYKENTFNAATVFNTLHHLDSKEEYYKFFENLHYILKPGAVVMVKELRDGLFYKTYNAVLHSKTVNRLFPSVFNSRDFVQTEEQDMHRRFFRDFLSNINDIMEASGKFGIVKLYKPLTFEQLIVLKAK